jgi:hypothetical protein
MKTGFVYLWFDRKHKRYYLGSHWGKETDSYVCSSTWMRNAYRRRPQDFKRRIVVRNISDRKLLLEKEHHYLSFIKQEELGKRYYNHTTYVPIPEGKGLFSDEVRAKLREKKLARTDCPRTGKKHSEETKRKFSETRKGRIPWNKGKTLTEEHRQKLSESHKGLAPSNKGILISEERKKKQSEKMRGRSLSDEHKQKIRMASLGKKRGSYNTSRRNETL